jgi:hypothetical protein
MLKIEETKDTMSVSFGVDKNIVVKREVKKPIFERNFFVDWIKKYETIEIQIKNNKPSPIHLFVYDQFPLSNNDNLQFEYLEYSKAEFDNNTGKLNWNLEIKPMEKRGLSFKYMLKYKKHMY